MTAEKMVVQLTVADLKALVAEAVIEALDARSNAAQGALLDQKALAEMLGTSERTIYSLRNEGLPCVMLGESPRFELAAVLAWMKQSTRDRTIAEMQSIWRAILDHE